MRFERFAVELTPFRMLRAAALALPIAFGLTAPTAAEPVFTDLIAQIHVGPGHAHSFEATQLFRDAGTNPRFTAVTFSTTDYYTNHGIDDGELVVQAKTAAELSAMSPPPSSPILVDVTVTMTNDAGQTASGTITFRTEYLRIDPATQHSATGGSGADG